MNQSRYYYTDTITDFLKKTDNSIIGDLTISSQHDINDETTAAWLEEINVMQEVLKPYPNCGSVFFEYNIPRMGRRIDVVAIIDNIIFLFEFKAMNDKFSREAFIQVWDYAGAPDKPCGRAGAMLTQNCRQTIHEERYVANAFHLCTEALDL